MDGRGAQEGRTALSAPGGGTRVGEKLTDLGLTLYSDPVAAGLECAPFQAVGSSSETSSVFDNGLDIGRVDWIRDGVINALAYPRATAREFDAPVAVPTSNLLMTGGSAALADMVAATERGLLLTTLWYIREVDPTTLLLTGLTRDGVYLVEDGRGHRGGQQLPVQRDPAGPAAARHRGRGVRGDAAARVGRLVQPRADADAADPRLPHVVGLPGPVTSLPLARACVLVHRHAADCVLLCTLAQRGALRAEVRRARPRPQQCRVRPAGRPTPAAPTRRCGSSPG